MTKAKRIEKVKDLLNEVVILCGNNTDDFLVDVSNAVKDLLVEENDDDVYSSDDYNSSEC